MKPFIFSLDLGSTKFCMSAFSKGTCHTLSVRSQGMLRGRIIDFEAALQSLSHLILQMEDAIEQPCQDVLLSLDFANIKEHTQTQRYAMDGHLITEKKLSKILSQFHHPQALYQHPRWFRIDAMKETLSPIGYTCSELEVEMVTYQGNKDSIIGLIELCNHAGLRVLDIQADIFANFHAYEASMFFGNHLIIDLGGISTKVLCIKDGKPFSAFMVHAGSASITKDLMHAYNIGFEQAEHLKLHYGTQANFEPFSMDSEVLIYPEDLQQKILPRLDEIIDYVERGMKAHEFETSTHTHILMGGGVLINGLRKRFTERLMVSFDEVLPQYAHHSFNPQFITTYGVFKDYCRRNPKLLQDSSALSRYVKGVRLWIKEMDLF
jgi:cell division protein FtsA